MKNCVSKRRPPTDGVIHRLQCTSLPGWSSRPASSRSSRQSATAAAGIGSAPGAASLASMAPPGKTQQPPRKRSLGFRRAIRAHGSDCRVRSTTTVAAERGLAAGDGAWRNLAHGRSPPRDRRSDWTATSGASGAIQAATTRFTGRLLGGCGFTGCRVRSPARPYLTGLCHESAGNEARSAPDIGDTAAGRPFFRALARDSEP